MPSRQISDLCERLQPLATQFLKLCNNDQLIKGSGVEVFITCTYRSGEEQNKLYAQGRTDPGKIVTQAQAGQSPHNCTEGQKPASRAFDVAVRYMGSTDLLWDAHSPVWKRLVAIGEALDLENGGTMLKRNGKPLGDWPHFQLKNWKRLLTP